MLERTQERLEVGGILASGINPQMDVRFWVLAMQFLELRLQLLVTAAGFGNRQRFGSGLFVFPQKGHVMSESRCVDSHTEMPHDRSVGIRLLFPIGLMVSAGDHGFRTSSSSACCSCA